MFKSDERVKLAEDGKLKNKAKAKITGEAEGVSLGFNTSENPKKDKEILFRKF